MSLPGLPSWLRALHLVIIASLALNVLYGSYQVFVALAPDGAIGPLFGAASELPAEHVALRRLYAIEVWVSFAGLAIYLGITEVLPRRRQ